MTGSSSWARMKALLRKLKRKGDERGKERCSMGSLGPLTGNLGFVLI